MDRSSRRLVEIATGLLAAAAIVFVGAVSLYVIVSNTPLHPDPAAVPSAAADVDVGPHAAAVEHARRLVRAFLVDENLPGLSMAVAVDGVLVWAEGFGYAEVERRAPMTPRTRFRLGSVSKTLTAAGLAVLYDRGQLDIDAPVRTYVPSYPQKRWTITPLQLMGDIAGVHRIRGDNNDQPPFGHCTSMDEALDVFAGEPLLFEPGTQYRFANSGWVLLSAVIEGAAAEPFPAFMSREVFAPLEMTRTALAGGQSDPDLVAPYGPDFVEVMRRRAGLKPEPIEPPDYSCFAGAGAFLSTPSDLVRLGSAMLKPGLLKADTLAVFQEPLRLASGASTGFAPGWKVETIPFAGGQERVLRHRATPFGGAITLTLFPDRGLVIAGAANGSHLDNVDRFARQVAEAFATRE